jgi:hypothetical protein
MTVAPDAGMQLDERDENCSNALSTATDSFDPDSNGTVERDRSPTKHGTGMRFPHCGMQIAESYEQSETAPTEIHKSAHRYLMISSKETDIMRNTFHRAG